MKRKLGIALMCLGTVLLVGALSLFLSNRAEERQAGLHAQNVVEQLVSQLDPTEPETPTEGTVEETVPEVTLPDPFDPVMTEVEIDGHRYVGYLSIPQLELQLPVMTDWSYPQLKIAPCRYSGSSKTDDLVIMAHNYKRHFGYIKDLPAGSRILFTDMDGVVTQYEILFVEVLDPGAVEEVVSGAYDLTLFTCTYGGKNRIAVRCDELEK